LKVTYRTVTDDDVPALKALWESAGWSGIVDLEWERCERSPFGTLIVVAADDATGELVGQLMFLRTRVAVDGRELAAARPGSLALAPSARGVASLTMLARLYRFGAQVLREEGVGLLHAIPAAAGRGSARPGVQRTDIPVWSLGLPLERPLELAPGFEPRTFGGWNGDIDRLSRRWSALAECSIVRASNVLEWKVGGDDYAVAAVARGGKLAGLAVWERNRGGDRPFICDVLAEDDGSALGATLAAAVNALDAHARSVPAHGINKVCVAATRVLEPSLRALGFAPEPDFDLPLIVHVLDDAIDPDAVSPDRWYVSVND